MERIEILQNFETSRWSGGTTTELFIYPPHASLKKLDFDFRLSKATIEVESSVFTPLPNISRTFMLLEGEVTLNHIGNLTAVLSPYKIDTFSGDWTTNAEGKCTPFNLMTRKGCTGEMSNYLLEKGKKLNFNSQADFIILYLYKGQGEINRKIGQTIQKESLVVINQFETPTISFKAHSKSVLIVVEIQMNS